RPSVPTEFVLTLSCANRPGIVAGVATHLFEAGYDIRDAQQFDDPETGDFFMRVLFATTREGASEEPARDFAAVAERFAMRWTLPPRAERQRVALLVSKFDHCLADLLYRWRLGELPMDLVAVISNHPREGFAHLDFEGVAFHHLPVTRATKLEQETKL